MRKQSLFTAGLMTAAFSVVPLTATVKADDGAKVYYKDGTRIETQDFDMKINLKLQPRFSYKDFDSGGRQDAGLSSQDDVTSFDLRRVEIAFAGNMLQKSFSYKIKTDLRADSGGSSLRDGWLQWNADGAAAGQHIRWGQFKVPYGRQENTADESLEFIDRSAVSDFFSPSRHMGAMLHGPITDDVTYYLEAFNGESTGEGINKPGVDNKIAGVAAITANIGDYGSREYEGDLRDDTSSTAFTTGVAVIYGQATGDPLGTKTDSDFERTDLDVDAGVRSNGFDGEVEFFYSDVNLTSVGGDQGAADIFGFYVQGGYIIDKKWGVAARFGYLEPDHDVSSTEDQEEYNLVLNYFINGHSLKLQSGVTWLVTNYDDSAGGSDTSDFRFEEQLAGNF